MNALVIVFPSVYEGFGIPAIEAFACGCPIAVSNTSSLPEIAGDAACYFDPWDELSIRGAVVQVSAMTISGQDSFKVENISVNTIWGATRKFLPDTA